MTIVSDFRNEIEVHSAHPFQLQETETPIDLLKVLRDMQKLQL